MRKFFHKLLSVLKLDGALIVAVAALWYTIDAQKTDREYKELLIRPRLYVHSQTEDFSIKIGNSGVGPAAVSRLVISGLHECFDSRSMTKDEWDKAGAIIRKSFDDRVRDEVFHGVTRQQLGGGIDLAETLPATDQWIAPNEVVEVLKVLGVEQAMKSLSSLDKNLEQQVKSQFIKYAVSNPVRVEYCSVSGKYCSEAADGCGVASPVERGP